MTPSAYDAWVTSEPMPDVDLHAPFEVLRGESAWVDGVWREWLTVVFDARDEDAPSLVSFRGERANEYAERYAEGAQS